MTATQSRLDLREFKQTTQSSIDKNGANSKQSAIKGRPRADQSGHSNSALPQKPLTFIAANLTNLEIKIKESVFASRAVR
jgi:hypothetical protein